MRLRFAKPECAGASCAVGLNSVERHGAGVGIDDRPPLPAERNAVTMLHEVTLAAVRLQNQ